MISAMSNADIAELTLVSCPTSFPVTMLLRNTAVNDHEYNFSFLWLISLTLARYVSLSHSHSQVNSGHVEVGFKNLGFRV